MTVRPAGPAGSGEGAARLMATSEEALQPANNGHDAEKAEAWRAAQKAQHDASKVRRARQQTAEASQSTDAITLENARVPWGLDCVIDDAEACQLFKAFCESEMSEENLLFYVAAGAWKSHWALTDPAEREEKAKHLVGTFLAPGASQEVSLPSGAGQPFDVIERNMFDRALLAARKSMWQDTFPRFEDEPACAKLKVRLTAPPTLSSGGVVLGKR